MCCWKHTTSTVTAKHDSRDHEELRHVGSTPIALRESMSREWDSQNDFAVGEIYFAVSENDFALSEIDCAVSEIDFAVLWNWFCRV